MNQIWDTALLKTTSRDFHEGPRDKRERRPRQSRRALVLIVAAVVVGVAVSFVHTQTVADSVSLVL